MAYPKPLSEKSLKKLYNESNLSDEVQSFLHSFFDACCNLYGAIPLRYVWKIYGELRNVPKLRKKDLITFSSIARREVHSYYVFEISELYSKESDKDMSRYVVSKELISVGYGKFHLFYSLIDQIDDKPYFIPNNILSYAESIPSEYELALLKFLNNLKSVTDVCAPKHGSAVPNEHKGMKLGEFSFMNSYERFELKWQKRPSAKAAFLEECSGTEAEKLMRLYKRMENIGAGSTTDFLQWFIDELEEAGVEITEGKLKQLVALTMEYHNNSHLWCLSGWSPNELSAIYSGNGPVIMSLGSGIQQAFADGSLDREEFIREVRKMGIEVIE